MFRSRRHFIDFLQYKKILFDGFRYEATAARVNPLMAHLQPDAEVETAVDLAHRRMKVDPISLYQPIIDRTKPIPVYNVVNLRLRGYDYVVLERFQRYVHMIVVTLGLTIKESWPSASRTWKTVTYKQRTTAVENEYNLSMYERTIQLAELETTKAHILLEILRTNLPVGVELTVKHPDEEDDVVRYLPDIVLREKQKELEQLVNPKQSKKDAIMNAAISAAAKPA